MDLRSSSASASVSLPSCRLYRGVAHQATAVGRQRAPAPSCLVCLGNRSDRPTDSPTQAISAPSLPGRGPCMRCRRLHARAHSARTLHSAICPQACLVLPMHARPLPSPTSACLLACSSACLLLACLPACLPAWPLFASPSRRALPCPLPPACVPPCPLPPACVHASLPPERIVCLRIPTSPHPFPPPTHSHRPCVHAYAYLPTQPQRTNPTPETQPSRGVHRGDAQDPVGRAGPLPQRRVDPRVRARGQARGGAARGGERGERAGGPAAERGFVPAPRPPHAADPGGGRERAPVGRPRRAGGAAVRPLVGVGVFVCRRFCGWLVGC